MNVPPMVHESLQLAQRVRDIALEDYKGPSKTEFESREKYTWLRDEGSSLWLDSGDGASIAPVFASEVSALTTNNTLVNQVVQTGSMDGLIAYAAREIRKASPAISKHDLIIEIAFLVNARLALNLVQRFGAHVSVELHPNLGFNVRDTLVFARRYYEINPDFFYIKVPMTPDGFIAVRLLSREGIPINFTLGFSARQNYLAAMLSRPRFVNVFLGRLNSLVEENGLGSPENVGEKAALASQEAIDGARKADPNIPTQQIAASMRNGEQVIALAGMDVLTMPPKVAGEYLEMDVDRSAIRRRYSQELRLQLNQDRPVDISALQNLWRLDEQFIAFVEDARKQGDTMAVGDEIIELSDKHEVNLFHPWTSEERRQIREHGKIPDLNQWPGAPVDDLMSISALETFAKDQVALDRRIEQLIEEH